MTLYHYVRTKDDLVDLMDDAIMGEVLIPDGELPREWRAAMRAIAARSHATFVRHPWAMQAMSGSRGGPNGMRHFEQSLAAVSSLAIDGRAKLELIAIVDDYVFGYVFRTGEVAASFAEMATEEVIAELMPYFEAQLATGEFPQIQHLFGADTRRTWELIVETLTSARFETGLDLLLDGIEAKLRRDGAI
jgi:AcrR family transcriptional regulator